MRTIPAGAFKANCLAIMDEVQQRRETVLITKRGKPVAKLVPAEPVGEEDDIFDSLAALGSVTGDVVEPVIPLEDWEHLK